MVYGWMGTAMMAIAGGVMLYAFIVANFSWLVWVPCLALLYFGAQVSTYCAERSRKWHEEAIKAAQDRDLT